MPFEAFRMRLVGLIDKLLDIIEKNPSYIFHLDAQAVVLEDYLEIRPDKFEALKKYIKNGNIVIGPWYLQNDFFLTSGEATVRNLIIGKKTAEKFGAYSAAGYAPDQFGNISQLPQILNNFGIDSFIFGRGYRERYRDADGEVKIRELPNEFIWEGPDGSRCLAVFLKAWYNNAQHIPESTDDALRLLDLAAERLKATNVSPYILLMNGVDHLEAQEDIPEIVENLKNAGVDIGQYALDKYIGDLKEYFKENVKEPYIRRGALQSGIDPEVLKGCWSSKPYLKRANVRAQDMLENKLEPVYSLMEKQGMSGVYPYDFLNYLWKQLLLNHPHDSICGCSVDNVHRHMEDRFVRIEEAAGELYKRALNCVSLHIAHPDKDNKNYVIIAVNPSESEASAAVRAVVDFICADKVRRFDLRDERQNSVPYEIISKKKTTLCVRSPVNLPGVLDVDRYEIQFDTGGIAPLAVKPFAVIPGKEGKIIKAESSAAAGGGNDTVRIANKHIETGFRGNKLFISFKETGKTIENPVFLEDQGDRGDSYMFNPADEPALVCYPSAAKITENTALRKTLRLTYNFKLPAYYNFERLKRASAVKNEKCCIYLTLNGDSDVLEIGYTVENAVKDHRLRIGVKSEIQTESFMTDSAFDYSFHKDGDNCFLTRSNTFHNASFISARDGERDISVFTEGLHETEKAGDVIYVTLARCTGAVSRNPNNPRQKVNVDWLAPDNQCLRKLEGRLGLSAGQCREPALLYVKAKQFRNGIDVYFNSFDRKKFSGGRFALQDAKLAKLYYVKDEYADVVLSGGSTAVWDDKNIVMTACKGGEKGGLIIRLLNMSERNVETCFTCGGDIWLSDMAETGMKYVGRDKTQLNFAPKQIKTLSIK